MLILSKFKNSFVFFLVLTSLFFVILQFESLNAEEPVYNAKAVLTLEWDTKETQKPIVPVDEIMELNLSVEYKIETGEYFGKGAVIGYRDEDALALVDLSIVETPSWCSAVIERSRLALNLGNIIRSGTETQNIKLYLTVDADSPAFTDGYVKINVSTGNLGLIKGTEDEFKLTFTPSFNSKIKTNIPDLNSKRITPSEEAIFPIEIENVGNARTRVLFEIQNVPDNWKATVSKEIVLDEAMGSKDTAYLTVIPPNDFGYHYEEADIEVIITPVRAEDLNDVGNSLYSNFIIQNRGFSSNGIEQILFYIVILVVIVFIVFYIVKAIKQKKVSS